MTTEQQDWVDAQIAAETAAAPQLQLTVKTSTKVNIDAHVDLPGGGMVRARSMARGIKLSIRSNSSRYISDIVVPDEALDYVDAIFAAVREAREAAPTS